MKICFETTAKWLESLRFLFRWNPDKTRVANVNKIASRNLFVVRSAVPDTPTIDEAKDNAQLSMLVAISALGDSRIPPFVSKDQTFEKNVFAAQFQYENHDCPLRTANNICHGSFLYAPVRPMVISES
jgi:hypothetical protein